MAAAPPAVPCALHPDLGQLAQPGRTLVRRADQPQTAPLGPPQRHRTQGRRPSLDQRLERRPETVRLDQDRRRDPRNPRRLLPTNQRLTTLEQAYVLVRCIEIGTEDSDLARRITRFANTQNAVLSQDFVFLDKQQHRLVQELQTMGYTYLLRSGESPGNADSSKVIEVRQAAVALACATGDVGHAVTAKREVSKLFDRDSGPYEALFNPSVEGIFLIRVTKVVSDVDEALDDAYSESEGQRIGIAVHGRRVIAHLILNNIGQKNLKNPDFDFDQALRDVQSSALRILDSFTENFPENAYPGNVFKNRKRCEELISNVK
ncbi:hypothetical protein GL309_03215 [Nocardia seriolae]|nr:hypothetical protein [Nocardia seriolae]